VTTWRSTIRILRRGNRGLGRRPRSRSISARRTEGGIGGFGFGGCWLGVHLANGDRIQPQSPGKPKRAGNGALFVPAARRVELPDAMKEPMRGGIEVRRQIGTRRRARHGWGWTSSRPDNRVTSAFHPHSPDSDTGVPRGAVRAV
jgi:hypothetical protein